MPVEVKVDARRALAKFSPAGIPEAVRSNLRRVIPGLTKQLGALVERKLEAGTKSRTRLTVKKEMVENQNEILGRVRTVWTGPVSKALVPLWLEEGTKPHVIEAKNASVLAFYWPKIAGMFFGPRVNHPGTQPIWYSRDSLAEMKGTIRTALTSAVREGAKNG